MKLTESLGNKRNKIEPLHCGATHVNEVNEPTKTAILQSQNITL